MTIREEAFAGKALSCPIIDAHTHIGPYHLNGWHQKYDRTGTEQIVEDFTRLGINCIVTSPHPMVQTRMREANALAAEAARKFPGKIYGYITMFRSAEWRRSNGKSKNTVMTPVLSD